MRRLDSFEFTDEPTFARDEYVAEIPPGLRTTRELLTCLSQALRLPGYFGGNWNALSDCLGDFHWLRPGRVCVRHGDLPAIPTGDLREYLDVLAEAQESWRDGATHSLRVLFPVATRADVMRLVAVES